MDLPRTPAVADESSPAPSERSGEVRPKVLPVHAPTPAADVAARFRDAGERVARDHAAILRALAK